MACGAKLVVTAGIKAADYKMTLNQYQDNGKIVGCLVSARGQDFVTGAPICVGGPAFVTHSINYNNWLPTLTARYRLWKQWSAYGQFAEGSVIPASPLFSTCPRQCSDSSQAHRQDRRIHCRG